MSASVTAEQLHAWRTQLDCGFLEVQAVCDDCITAASHTLTPQGLSAYLDSARTLGKMGRGPEPVLAFLQTWPEVVAHVGEAALPFVMQAVQTLTKSPNGRAIAPLLQTLPAVVRRLPVLDQLQGYLRLSLHLMERTSTSIHGIHKTYASPSLPDFFALAPKLLSLLTLQGLQRWVDYGLRHYSHHPEQQRDYFTMHSADSRAVLQRERHGTLLVDHTRVLDLYMRALWQDTDHLVPYPTVSDVTHRLQPYYDAHGIRLPDAYDTRSGVSGLDRYRAALAHMAAHRRWSQPIFADNYSPAQRLCIECFEDARIDLLAVRLYPGLHRVFSALHPTPVEGACDTRTHSGLRHRLALLSRALLDQAEPRHHPAATSDTFAQRFMAELEGGASSTMAMAALALSYLAKTRTQSDQLADTFFTDTEVDYRDDNRHLWRFHELSDDEETFDTARTHAPQDEAQSLPPRLYPEWDYSTQSERPDWVSLYESLHPSGQAAEIDQIMSKHSALAKQLQRLLALLKPQDRTRLRYQSEGNELDLDVALRAVIDLKSGSQPDPRVYQRHTTNGRSLAVTLVLDLSASLNDTVAGTSQTVLDLSREAVSLLAWAIEQLGDRFAIAGFHSNTRHEVRYLHLKGFGEHWDDTVKSRLAAMQASYSTRMGTALRHAAHTLSAQSADKKLMLVLTDGKPSDVDAPDEQLLVEDARHAVQGLSTQGIYTHCISLDPNADAYVGRIFGQHYTVIDRVEQLPEKLPQLFMALTR